MRLAFEGDLQLSVDGVSATMSARDRELIVDLESPNSFIAAVLGDRRPAHFGTLREAAKTLYEMGLTVKIVNRGQTLLTLGREAQPGLSGLVVPHLQIGVGDAFRILIR